VFGVVHARGFLGNGLGPSWRHHFADAAKEPDETVESYRVVVLSYAALGIDLALLFARLSSLAEVSLAAERERLSPTSLATAFGITRSRHVVLKLSSLFALDSFAGGVRGAEFRCRIGFICDSASTDRQRSAKFFFWANVLRNIGAPASRLASAIGLIRTMVFTHLPSNVLAYSCALMPNLKLAVCPSRRFSISQMDVPHGSRIRWRCKRWKNDPRPGGLRSSAYDRRGHQPLFAELLFASHP